MPDMPHIGIGIVPQVGPNNPAWREKSLACLQSWSSQSQRPAFLVIAGAPERGWPAEKLTLGYGWLRIGTHAEEKLGEIARSAWVLLLHDDRYPVSADVLRKLSWLAAEHGPSLFCCRCVKSDGTRYTFDWWQAPNVRMALPHRELDYGEESPTAYGDTGAICLPVSTLKTLLGRFLPHQGAWGGGANITLAQMCRNESIPVRLVPEAMIVVRQ